MPGRLSAFKRRRGCSVLVNTNFNVRGERSCAPVVSLARKVETLVAGDCILSKDQQDKSLAKDYKDKFELD
jgi:carbamoyltransferase